MQDEKNPAAQLLSQIEAQRIENARFRRKVEDLLYNLDGENMPTVEKRLSAVEKLLADLVGGEMATLTLRQTAEDGSEARLTLSPTALTIPYLYRTARENGTGLLPLYMDADGRIYTAKS